MASAYYHKKRKRDDSEVPLSSTEALLAIRRLIPVIDQDLPPLERKIERLMGHKKKLDAISDSIRYLCNGWNTLSRELASLSDKQRREIDPAIICDLGKAHARVADMQMKYINTAYASIQQELGECEHLRSSITRHSTTCMDQYKTLLSQADTNRASSSSSSSSNSSSTRMFLGGGGSESALLYAWHHQPLRISSSASKRGTLSRRIAIGEHL